jgi:hypothetical protein
MTKPAPEAGPVYVTEVWCPPADDGVQRLFAPMREPEPLPEPDLEAEP